MLSQSDWPNTPDPGNYERAQLKEQFMSKICSHLVVRLQNAPWLTQVSRCTMSMLFLQHRQLLTMLDSQLMRHIFRNLLFKFIARLNSKVYCNFFTIFSDTKFMLLLFMVIQNNLNCEQVYLFWEFRLIVGLAFLHLIACTSSTEQHTSSSVIMRNYSYHHVQQFPTGINNISLR